MALIRARERAKYGTINPKKSTCYPKYGKNNQDQIALITCLCLKIADQIMQRYTIIHRTYYNYSAEVILGPHTLLLRPREDHEIHIESFTLNTRPISTLLWHRDIEGNSVAIANFDLPTPQLVIDCEIIIQQFNEEPLDFMVADYAMFYPFFYQRDDNVLLAPYMIMPVYEEIDIVNRWIACEFQTIPATHSIRFRPAIPFHSGR